MDRDVKSEKAKKHVEGESHVHPPWLDLLEPLFELILERLPLFDYVRFAAVCKKWHYIQKSHRLRYSPLPPPMPHPLPWLVPFYVPPNHELKCYSPFEQRFYSLPNPCRTNCTRTLASCGGWLLLLERLSGTAFPTNKRLFLYNPVTCIQILLPLLSRHSTHDYFGLMSAPPSDPECTILLSDIGNVFLHRLIDRGGWTMVTDPIQGNAFLQAVYFRGKFYFNYKLENRSDFYVLDPKLPVPKLYNIEMEFLDPEFDEFSWEVTDNLAQVDGEMFLVETFPDPCGRTFDIRLFKADLTRKKWILVDTLGDCVLFHGRGNSLFSLASDVGCKKNCIYYTNPFKKVWFLAWFLTWKPKVGLMGQRLHIQQVKSVSLI